MNSKARALLSYSLFAAYLCYHFLIDRSYRLSADDFAVTDLATQGIPGVGFAMEMYLNWEGPFLGMTLLGMVCWLANVTSPCVPLMLVKGTMVLSTSVLLRVIGKRFTISWTASDILGIAVLLVSGLYLISPNQPEIWHWLVGTPYLLPLIFIQLGVAALVSERVKLAIIPFAFVMQSRATYALLVFGLLFLISMYNILKDVKRKEWIVFITSTLVFLLIYLAAPGNYARMTEHGNSLAFLASQFKTGLQNLFISYNIAKVDRISLAILASFLFIGSGLRNTLPKKALLWSVPIALYLSFAIAHELLFVMVTGYCEWTRVLSLHSFLFMSICVMYGYWIIATTGLAGGKWFKFVGLGSVILLIGLTLRGITHELAEAEQLRTEYDKRMEVILSHPNEGDTLYVSHVNYNGKMYFEDFSKDPDFWINKDFCKAYNLPFKVAVKGK